MIASQMARRLLLDLLGLDYGIATLWLWLAPDQSQMGYLLQAMGPIVVALGLVWSGLKDAFSGSDVSIQINYLPLLCWQPAPMGLCHRNLGSACPRYWTTL